MSVYILGISAFYHDSASALVKDGDIVAAAQEERFTRKKHDPGFPANAVRYCLEEAGITISDLTHVVFYDKPLIKFERLLETYLMYTPAGLKSFIMAMPVWLKEKLFLKVLLKRELAALDESVSQDALPSLMFTEHHQSHAASAFFPSPFEKAAVLCLDGVGEWATTSLWLGDGNKLEGKWQIDFPHSLGLLYSAFTYYTGFKVNSGEYKIMGLAPYGEPKYVDDIYKHLIDVKDDGSFQLDMSYFNYAAGLTMTNKKFHDLFGGPPRQPESDVTQKEMDLARSIQVVTEDIVLKIASHIHSQLDVDYLCLAGGVALNCVANGRIYRESPFKDMWIQPAAGDAGGALGAALSVWYQYLDKPRTAESSDSMKGSYLGPEFSPSEIKEALTKADGIYEECFEDQLFDVVADALADGQVVGWFNGRMEFGPRALGGRSILGDARNTDLQTTMNLKIKYRESFRPFAPSVLREDVADFFQHDGPSPYMLLVADVTDAIKHEMTDDQSKLFGIDKLKIPRSEIPAVTHVDYSARIQTVDGEYNPRYHKLISTFKEKTGCPVLVNTSFNVRGEPIVCTPEDAFRCFMRTEMDMLVLGPFVLKKGEQTAVDEDDSWKEEFTLD